MPIKASESGRGEASEVDPASVATTGPGNVEAASSATSEQWNPGMYGPWRVEQQDLIEVWSYRAGLLTSAAAALIVGAALLAPADGALREALRPLENPACVAGVAGFGVSVYFIHIYVAQLKRFVQVLWAVGSASAIWLMMTQGQAVPEYVAAQPSSLWLVGPFFAAVTGVAFKEGVCYGKGEAFALTLLVPTLMLGHLSSLLPASMEQALGVVVLALFAVFAGRKVGQAAKDDIGDKSVFEFLKLPPDEQERLVDALQRDGQLQ